MNSGPARMYHFGPWQIPFKVTKVLCADGVRRTARQLSQPDTFFSIPASIVVCKDGKRYTVRGFVTGREYSEDDPRQDYEFISYSYRKNGHIL